VVDPARITNGQDREGEGDSDDVMRNPAKDALPRNQPRVGDPVVEEVAIEVYPIRRPSRT
jgi:hypothetical protein